MTDENKPLNYRTLADLYAAYNSGVVFEVRDSEGTYPVTDMAMTEDAARLYVFAKTSTFPRVPWSWFLPDGSHEDQSHLNLRHSAEPAAPAQPVAAPVDAAVQALIDSAPTPFRRLGELLARTLDEDQWAHAQSLLLGGLVAVQEGRDIQGDIDHYNENMG